MLDYLLKGKTVILGIGNTLRRDDGAGPKVIERLREAQNCRHLLIDAGTAPENFTGVIVKEMPDTVIIIDAADMGGNPGEYSLLKKDEILKQGFSTHNMSPDLFIGYLERFTKANIYMIGIQPADTSFGEGLTKEVEVAVEKICDYLEEGYHA